MVAKDNNLLCVSDTVLYADVADNIVYPTAAASKKNNTSCDTSAYNGQVYATANGGTAPGFTFAWYKGLSTNPADSITDTPNVIALPPNQYMVIVTESATGCTDTTTTTVGNSLTYPIVNASVASNQSICTLASLNGRVQADVAGNTADYSFFWWNGDVTPADTSSNDFYGPVYSGLAAGKYTVIARTDSTFCPSLRAVVEVKDSIERPNVSTAVLLNNSSCDILRPVGKLSAFVNPGAQVEPDYSFNWYAGTDTTGTWVADSSTVQGLKAGAYAVYVVDMTTGCDTTAQATIIKTIPTITPTITVTDNTNCAPFNGAISASAVGGAGNYTFNWWFGAFGSPAPGSQDTTAAALNDMDPGAYTLIVQDSLNCTSAVTIDSIQDNPSPARGIGQKHRYDRMPAIPGQRYPRRRCRRHYRRVQLGVVQR